MSGIGQFEPRFALENDRFHAVRMIRSLAEQVGGLVDGDGAADPGVEPVEVGAAGDVDVAMTENAMTEK